MNLILTFMIMVSFIMLWLNHPLSLGMILIMQTFITSMITGYILSSFLFSYIIIMIMLSGALVLFIYMSSIASNEKFNLSLKLLMFSMLMSPIIFLIINYYNNNYYNNFMEFNEVISLIKTFNTMTAIITMMMIMYLLLTMIVVSNNSKSNEGPLRMKK